MPFSRLRSNQRFALRWGFFRKSHALWNCLAFHLIVDDTLRLMRLTVGIPSILTFFLELPSFPRWMGAARIAGGSGERAEYGLWHDYHETKLQWRRIINRGGKGSGWEWRRVYDHPDTKIARQESLISHLVIKRGNAWAKANGVDSWRLAVTSWRATSGHWWIPCLYDHYFILYAAREGGLMGEASMRTRLSPRLTAQDVFDELSKQIVIPPSGAKA